MTPPIEPNRRKEDIRLALLEQKMEEHGKGIELLHTRVHEMRSEFSIQLTEQTNQIIDRIDKRADDCADHKERTIKTESSISYHLINAGATWGAVVGLGSWVILNMMDMKELLASYLHVKGIK